MRPRIIFEYISATSKYIEKLQYMMPFYESYLMFGLRIHIFGGVQDFDVCIVYLSIICITYIR